MKTKDAIKQAGNAKALAVLLDITPSAISQWGDEVPELRVWQLKSLRPMWFKAYQPSDPNAESDASQPVLVISEKKGA